MWPPGGNKGVKPREERKARVANQGNTYLLMWMQSQTRWDLKRWVTQQKEHSLGNGISWGTYKFKAHRIQGGFLYRREKSPRHKKRQYKITDTSTGIDRGPEKQASWLGTRPGNHSVPLISHGPKSTTLYSRMKRTLQIECRFKTLLPF